MVVRKKKDKIPRFIMIPWEGEEYRFFITQAMIPRTGKDILIARGESTYPLHQHGDKWRLTIEVAADDMETLKAYIMSGFENQKVDQARFEKARLDGRWPCAQCAADPIL